MEDGEPTAPNSRARIRDNQRRSRARHREFVEDLQRKVREYETKGVQATLDMQRAARVVALENSRLRSLLASKGVSDDEVERYLASPGNAFQARQGDGTASSCCSEGGSGTPGLVSQRSPSSPPGSTGVATDAGALMCLKRLVNEDGPHPFNTLGPQPEDRAARALTTSLRSQPAQNDSTTSAPATARTELPSFRMISFSPHEMSCTIAAEIIAGAHGHGDENMARTVLGCADSSNCVIKNTQVLQVLQNS